MQVFVPSVAEQPGAQKEFEWDDIPLFRFLILIKILVLGWPLYLLTNVSGRPYDAHASHFDPYSPIFSKSERSQIVASDAVLGLVVYGLYASARAFGWAWFAKVSWLAFYHCPDWQNVLRI